MQLTATILALEETGQNTRTCIDLDSLPYIGKWSNLRIQKKKPKKGYTKYRKGVKKKKDRLERKLYVFQEIKT